MQYTLIKNFFSRKKRFEILDLHETPLFFVKKENVNMFSSRFVFLDQKGNETIEVKQYYKGLKSNYAIYEKGIKTANLHRKFRFLKSYFLLDCLDGETYRIECDRWRKNYTFLKEEETVAELTRISRKLTRTYELTCLQMKHQAFFLASAVILDVIFEQDGSG